MANILGKGVVEITPNMRGMKKDIVNGVDSILNPLNRRFNRIFSRVGKTGAKAVNAQLATITTKNIGKLTEQVARSEDKLTNARQKHEIMLGKLRTAEAALNEKRAKYKLNSSQVLGAETRLAQARLNAQNSLARVSRAETVLSNTKTQLTKANNALAGSYTNADKKATAFNSVFSRMSSAVPGVSKSTSAIGKAFSALGNVGKTLGKTGALAVAGVAVGAVSKATSGLMGAIDGAISRLDTLERFPKIMQNLGVTTSESDRIISSLDKHFTGLPVRLDSASQAYMRVFSLTGQNTKQAEALTKGYYDMMLAGGAGVEAADSAMQQWMQVMSQVKSGGAIDLQSWQIIMNGARGSITQLAQALLGPQATAEDLRDAVNDGRISFDDLNNAIVTMDTDGMAGFVSYSEQAKTATNGIDTQLKNVASRIVKIVAEIANIFGYDNITSMLEAWANKLSEVGKFVQSVRDYSQPLRDWISGHSEEVNTMLTGVVILLGLALAPLAGVVALVGALVAGLAYVTGVVFQWFMELPTTIQGFAETAKAKFSELKESVVAKFREIVDNIRLKFDEMAGAVSAKINVIAGFFRGLPARIRGALGSFSSIGVSIVDGIVSGITGAAERLVNRMKSLARSALNAAKNALIINSPSRVFRDVIGVNIVRGITAGISAEYPTLDSEMGHLSHLADTVFSVPVNYDTDTAGIFTNVSRETPNVVQNLTFTQVSANEVLSIINNRATSALRM